MTFLPSRVLLVVAAIGFFGTHQASAQPARYGAISPVPTIGVQIVDSAGGGARITFVQPGNTAYRLGLEPGDVVLGFNGMPVYNVAGWEPAMRAAAVSGQVVITLRNWRTNGIETRTFYTRPWPQQGPIWAQPPRTGPLGNVPPPRQNPEVQVATEIIKLIGKAIDN